MSSCCPSDAIEQAAEAQEFPEGRRQKRAVEFWDRTYADQGAEAEWICPVDQTILAMLPPTVAGKPVRRVVEVGCGESDFGAHAHAHYAALAADKDAAPAEVLCLDISRPAIERQRQRHARSRREGLSYRVADVLRLPEEVEEASVDVVLDKGCADTFQFRGRTRDSDALLGRLFSGVLACLREGGWYFVVSPRPKMRGLRRRGGWAMVERKVLGEASNLVERSGGAAVDERGRAAYLYRCRKQGGWDAPARDLLDTRRAEERAALAALPERCLECGMEREGSKYRKSKAWRGHLAWCCSSTPSPPTDTQD